MHRDTVGGGGGVQSCLLLDTDTESHMTSPSACYNGTAVSIVEGATNLPIVRSAAKWNSVLYFLCVSQASGLAKILQNDTYPRRIEGFVCGVRGGKLMINTET